MNLSVYDFFIILGIISIFFIIGYKWRKRANSLNWFFLHGRRMESKSFIWTFLATNISAAIVYLALAEQGFAIGLSIIWIPVAWVFGIFLFRLLSPRLTNFFRRGHTSPEFLGEKYGSRFVRILASFITIFVFCGTVAIEIFAVGCLLENFTVQITRYGFMILLASIMIVYTSLSGYLGTVKTDKWQLSFITIAYGLILAVCIQKIFAVGWTNFFSYLPGKQFLSPFSAGPGLIIAMWVLMVPFQLSALDMWQRCAAVNGDETKIKRGLFSSSFLYFPFYLIPILVGIVMRAIEPNVSSPLQAGIAFLKYIPSPVGIGLVLGGLIAAVISTADSLLIGGVYTFLYDIYAGTKGINLDRLSDIEERNILVASRIWIILFGLLSLLFALLWMGSLYDMVVAIFSAQIILAVPIFFAIFSEKRVKTSSLAAFVSLVMGFSLALSLAIWGILKGAEVGKQITSFAPIFAFFTTSLVFFILLVVRKKLP